MHGTVSKTSTRAHVGLHVEGEASLQQAGAHMLVHAAITRAHLTNY